MTAQTIEDEINGVSVRQAIVPALKRLGAWRDSVAFQGDTLKQGVRTVPLAEEIKKDGFPLSVHDIALQLTDIAQKDASAKLFANFAGGSWPQIWNNHEWSLPPVA
jgi:hypothetical protein